MIAARHLLLLLLVALVAQMLTGCAYQPRFTGSDHWADRIKKDW